MKCSNLFLLPTILLAACCFSNTEVEAQTDVVAFWGFENDFLFPDGTNAQDFAADVNNTVGNPNLQGFIGDGTELDSNGGGGFRPYTSSVSGATFGPSRTIRWTDARGGGNDFSIAGQTLFDVAEDGGPVVSGEDFGNDALVYITLDATGFQDLELRFDLEGTPGLDPADPTAALLVFGFVMQTKTTFHWHFPTLTPPTRIQTTKSPTAAFNLSMRLLTMLPKSRSLLPTSMIRTTNWRSTTLRSSEIQSPQFLNQRQPA